MNEQSFIGVLDYTMNYEDGDLMIYLGDGSGVLNHSADCNSEIVYNEEKNYKKLRSIATKDIKKGEEITENYSYYPKMRQDWVIKTFRRYVPTRLEFETDFNIEKIVR